MNTVYVTWPRRWGRSLYLTWLWQKYGGNTAFLTHEREETGYDCE